MPKVTVGLRAKYSISGSTSYTHTLPTTMNAYVLYNDGSTDITLSINGENFTVKPGEVFDECLESFKTVVITNAGNSAYRAYARG